jgi:MtN3 and saliva related transmembrane protein
MNVTSVVGILASVFTAIALLPQLNKLIKEKRPDNISLGMLASLMIGVGLWVYYGFLKDDWIIIVSNSFSLLVNMIIIVLTIKYKNKPPYVKRY